MPKQRRAPIRDEAMVRATGKNRAQWFALLDQDGAKTMPHRDIAILLSKKHDIPSWWCQMVTVEYEYARKKRVLGGTEVAGFEIGVTKTLSISPTRAWRILFSAPGRALWVGKPRTFSLKPGRTFASAGVTGEIRTLRTGKRVRMLWKDRKMRAPSTLQVTVTPRQSMRGTCIGFHQEKLVSAKERERMRLHWQRTLAGIEKLSRR